MRIIQLISDLASGGGQRFVVDLSNELSKYNDVYIITFRTKGKYLNFYRSQISKNIHQIDFEGSNSIISKLKQLLVVTYYLLKINPDVVHTHLIGFNYSLLSLPFLKRTKYFYTIHSVASKDTNQGISAWLRKKFLRKYIHAITISDICNRTFIDYYGFSSYRIIENGCRDLVISDKIDAVKDEILKYKMTEKTKIFVCVARIMEEKNHKLLIEAFNIIIKTKGIDCALLLIGDFEENIQLKSELDALIRTNQIHFLGVRKNIADYLSICDYFCLSSLWEGLPIAILEAGISGCYPICTPVGGIPDIIKDQRWGMLSKDVSIESFVEAIEKALSLNMSKKEIKNLYVSKYTMEECAKKYSEIYASK